MRSGGIGCGAVRRGDGDKTWFQSRRPIPVSSATDPRLQRRREMAKKALSLDVKLKDVLRAYRDSFSMKTYSEENDDPDPLMDVFGITPDHCCC